MIRGLSMRKGELGVRKMGVGVRDKCAYVYTAPPHRYDAGREKKQHQMKR